MNATGGIEQDFESFRADLRALREGIARSIVGQEEPINLVLTALVMGGHLLLEGLPGTGKTALARALAIALDLTFHRVQCTADLTPADLIGTYVITETPQGRRQFEFQRGPLFSNLVLADQINRTAPKTQAALLEAMEEATVTVATETFALPRPYLVVATQNPLEMEGTFPLPEAQLDRFAFCVAMGTANAREMEEILDRTAGPQRPNLGKLMDGRRVLELGQVATRMPIHDAMRRWAIALVSATQPNDPHAPPEVRRYLRYGAGLRALQALVLGAKVRAILEGRSSVAAEDVRRVAPAALCHRLVLNFEGRAENVRPDEIVERVLEAVPPP